MKKVSTVRFCKSVDKLCYSPALFKWEMIFFQISIKFREIARDWADGCGTFQVSLSPTARFRAKWRSDSIRFYDHYSCYFLSEKSAVRLIQGIPMHFLFIKSTEKAKWIHTTYYFYVYYFLLKNAHSIQREIRLELYY